MSAIDPGGDDIATLAKGGRTNFFGFLLRLAARLPFLFIAGRIYGPELLGRFAYAVLIVEFAAQLATLGLKRGLALGVEAGFQLVDPGAVHAVAGGDLSGALVVDEQGGDDQAGFRRGLRHGRASSRLRVSPMTCDMCRLCLETCVADVVNQHTVSPTN